MPQDLVWTPDLIARFWEHHAGTPQSYFSFTAGRDVVRQTRRYIRRGGRVRRCLSDRGLRVISSRPTYFRIGTQPRVMEALRAASYRVRTPPNLLAIARKG